MKLLLGATVALLLGALAVSWQGMTKGVRDTPPDEIARLRKQVAELRLEQDRLQLEKQLQQIKSTAPAEYSRAGIEMDAVKEAMVEANKTAIEEYEKERIERDSQLADQEELLLDQRGLESKDIELKRAKMIAQALLIGKVKEYVEDAEYGGFITFDVLMPEQVQPGTILAIRRRTGILGLLKVSDVTIDGGIANPLPGFGQLQPAVGDELILPPQY